MKKLKIGDKLMAINECKMTGSNKNTLTIGKIYSITLLNKKELCVVDDDEIDHYFKIKELPYYFITSDLIEKITKAFKMRKDDKPTDEEITTSIYTR